MSGTRPDGRVSAAVASRRTSKGTQTLVATLGPASSTARDAALLLDSGASSVRLNASHLDEEALEAYLESAVEAGFPPDSVIVDLQGGKTRLGELPEPLVVSNGDVLVLVPAPEPAAFLDPPRIPVDRPEFLRALEAGDTVRVDDGRVALTIEGGATADQGRRARVRESGRVAGRKGVALVGREVDVGSDLLERDRRLMRVAAGRGVVQFAVSYATSPGLLVTARHEAQLAGADASRVRIHAKIENPLAVRRLDALLPASDAVWLCRGDLGAEVGLEELPRLQASAIASAAGRVPLLIAGQVLHHMTVSPRPTRSEVCHVADLVWRGVVGFVLSDETAQGPHGPAAVRWLRRVVDAAA